MGLLLPHQLKHGRCRHDRRLSAPPVSRRCRSAPDDRRSEPSSAPVGPCDPVVRTTLFGEYTLRESVRPVNLARKLLRDRSTTRSRPSYPQAHQELASRRDPPIRRSGRRADSGRGRGRRQGIIYVRRFFFRREEPAWDREPHRGWPDLGTMVRETPGTDATPHCGAVRSGPPADRDPPGGRCGRRRSPTACAAACSDASARPPDRESRTPPASSASPSRSPASWSAG